MFKKTESESETLEKIIKNLKDHKNGMEKELKDPKFKKTTFFKGTTSKQGSYGNLQEDLKKEALFLDQLIVHLENYNSKEKKEQFDTSFIVAHALLYRDENKPDSPIKKITDRTDDIIKKLETKLGNPSIIAGYQSGDKTAVNAYLNSKGIARTLRREEFKKPKKELDAKALEKIKIAAENDREIIVKNVLKRMGVEDKGQTIEYSEEFLSYLDPLERFRFTYDMAISQSLENPNDPEMLQMLSGIYSRYIAETAPGQENFGWAPTPLIEWLEKIKEFCPPDLLHKQSEEQLVEKIKTAEQKKMDQRPQ